jgi:HSP20 family molecular chaperone IbpA
MLTEVKTEKTKAKFMNGVFGVRVPKTEEAKKKREEDTDRLIFLLYRTHVEH